MPLVLARAHALDGPLSVRPFDGRAADLVIRSLVWRPARFAGEPPRWATILIRPSSCVISMPTPTKRPVVPRGISFSDFFVEISRTGPG